MSADRELLELAAKAAEINAEFHGDDDAYESEGMWLKGERSPDNSKYWNPLKNDGDALRLAVTLGLNVNVIRNDGTFVSRYESEPVIAEKRGQDPYATTRRAIVRAAAKVDSYYNRTDIDDIDDSDTELCKPLTDEQIGEFYYGITHQRWSSNGSWLKTFARAIEAAHGIKE